MMRRYRTLQDPASSVSRRPRNPVNVRTKHVVEIRRRPLTWAASLGPRTCADGLSPDVRREARRWLPGSSTCHRAAPR